VRDLILCLLGLDAIEHFPIALNKRTELGELRLVVLKEGELFGSRRAATESTGLPHVVGAGHGICSTTI